MSSFAPQNSILRERFHVLDVLCEGAFGLAYKATRKSNGELVTVKLLRHATLRGPAGYELRKRLVREAALSTRMSSPHVLRLLESGVDGDDIFLVYEFVTGIALAQVVARGALDSRMVRRIADHVLRALMGAHGTGLVHRALRPESIVLVPSGPRPSTKVLDFCLADLLERTGERNLYAAPELSEATRSNPLVDVYSVGQILLYCLTGRSPAGASGAYATHQPLTPAPLVLPTWLENDPLGPFIERCCAIAPEARFPSVDAMLKVLRDIEATAPYDPNWTFDADGLSVAAVAGTVGRDTISGLVTLDDPVEIDLEDDAPTFIRPSTLGYEETDVVDEDALQRVRSGDFDLSVLQGLPQASPRAPAGMPPGPALAELPPAAGPAPTTPRADQTSDVPLRDLRAVARHGSIHETPTPFEGPATPLGSPAVEPAPRPGTVRWPVFAAGAVLLVGLGIAATVLVARARTEDADAPAADAEASEPAARTGRDKLAKPTATKLEPSVLLLDGKRANAAGAFDDAHTAFDEILSRYPDNIAAHDGAGWALVGLGRFQEAAAHFAIARSSADYAGSALAGLATAHHGMGDNAKAKLLCDEYIARFPDGPMLEDVRALASELAGQQ